MKRFRINRKFYSHRVICKKRFVRAAAVAGISAICLAGCGVSSADAGSSAAASVESMSSESAAEDNTAPENAVAEGRAVERPEAESAAADGSAVESEAADSASSESSSSGGEADTIVTGANTTSGGLIDATDLFSDRDMTQTADTADAVTYTVSDGEDIHITEEGVYVLTGTASNVTVYVETSDQDAKVQLVLQDVRITNDDAPCIYVKEADKVFVTSAGDNTLAVTGSFTSDGDTNTDGVIFSKDDLVLNGTGTLQITSTDNGVVCKDDLKVTGGTYTIEAASKTLDANDSIRIAGGTFALTAGTDALHAENSDDDTLGYIYICGGDFTISAGDDGIHANAVAQIDGGTFNISAGEGIEATSIQINDGTISIDGRDDGINAAQKSNSYDVFLEINGGDITITMAAGDTDGIDSNGDLTITGGTINVTGQSAFDCDGTVEFTGGTVIINGEQVDTIPIQMMGGPGGGMHGGMGGGMPGDMNGGPDGMNGDRDGMNGDMNGGMRGGHMGGGPGGGFGA